MSGSVASVGSLNLDLTIAVGALPAPGETVIGLGARRAPGGKGGNVAAAAAAAGAAVAMVGAVGDDADGTALIADLVARGVNVDAIRRCHGAASGGAVIYVDAQRGENMIVVNPGANGQLRPADVDVAAVHEAAVVTAQFEIPPATVLAAARAAGGRFLLNPSPVRALESELLAAVDVLVVNQGELAVLAGVQRPRTLAQAAAAVRRLAPPCAVFVTAGAAGALLYRGTETPAQMTPQIIELPPPSVMPVDTTGAGDTLLGVLAARLAASMPLADAAADAVIAGSLSTLGSGARGALPNTEEIERCRR